jgi:ribose transport system substrate-binding protein
LKRNRSIPDVQIVNIQGFRSKGEKVPENVDTGANLITKENMNSERSKELLTPDVKK